MTLEKTTTEFTFGRLSDIKTVVKVSDAMEYNARLQQILPITNVEVITKDYVSNFRYTEKNGKIICL